MNLAILEAVTLSSLLTDVGSIVTSAISWVSSLIGEITSEPLLLFACILPFVGFGVHMLKMLLGTRA